MLLEQLPAALASHRPQLHEADRRAAVAILVRAGAAGDELLFIHRAEHPLDPWSGHMAFPGGMVDPGDGGPLDAAVRETQEELALDLRATATLLGRLSDVNPRSLRASLSISPFVFAARGDVPPLQPNDEVQEALWVPWSYLAEPRNRSTMTWARNGVSLPMPCYDLGGRAIWGLTLRMVDELLELATRPASV